MKTLISSALLVLTTSLIHAQFITWSAPSSITGDSDIVTTGTYIDAIKTGATSAPDITVNGVVFHTHATPSVGAFSDGPIAITGDEVNGSNTGIGTATTTDASYNALLSGILYFFNGSTTSSGTATFSGLTAGGNYRVEIWNTQSANSGYGPTTFTGSGPIDTVAFGNDFAIGTFTAAGTTASFSMTAPDGFPMISAISLFSTDAIPEPSTYAMLGLGLLALVSIRRFRKLSA